MTLHRIGGDRAGASLVESLVAVTLISMGLLSLAPLSLRVARTNAVVAMTAERTAAMQRYVARYQSVSTSTLAPGTTTCNSVGSPFPHQMCALVTQPNLTQPLYRVRIVVQPDDDLQIPADTVVLERLIPPTGPFHIP
jgi:Tfp pilus assembly protein PilV